MVPRTPKYRYVVSQEILHYLEFLKDKNAHTSDKTEFKKQSGISIKKFLNTHQLYY